MSDADDGIVPCGDGFLYPGCCNDTCGRPYYQPELGEHDNRTGHECCSTVAAEFERQAAEVSRLRDEVERLRGDMQRVADHLGRLYELKTRSVRTVRDAYAHAQELVIAALAARASPPGETTATAKCHCGHDPAKCLACDCAECRPDLANEKHNEEET